MAKKVVKRVYKISLITLLILVVLTVVLLKPIDYSPYKNMPYYHMTMRRLDSINVNTNPSKYFKAGWAKENITPDYPIPIASYGIRKNFEGVHDSLWVRTFVFDNGNVKTAIISLDLLIFPPLVTKKLKDNLPPGFNLNNTYLSATHTHNGTGGWAEGVGGKFLAGTINEEYVKKIVGAIKVSIEKAEEDMENAQIGFAKLNAFYLVKNRLVNKGEVDPWLRVVKIRKESGKVGLLTSFSAHPTCISSKIDSVSRDYPGVLVDLLERSGKVEFAAFMAGSVGSQAPLNYKMSNFNLTAFIGKQLSHKIISSVDTIALAQVNEMNMINFPIDLREPHLKISNSLRFRPWVFNWLLGRHTFHINVLKLGHLVLVGTPCDFSGTLVDSIEEDARKKNLQVMITSFNGGYMGYITEDQYYQLAKSETKEMNWFGPYNGSYFLEIIEQLISKFQ